MEQLLTSLNAVQAAARAGRGRSAVRHALETADLHGVQRTPGGRWLVEADCVDAWAAGVRCPHGEGARRLSDEERVAAGRERCREYGRELARQAPPLQSWQIESAARILAGFPPAPTNLLARGGGAKGVRRNDGT